jgi:hypothetical protein
MTQVIRYENCGTWKSAGKLLAFYGMSVDDIGQN